MLEQELAGGALWQCSNCHLLFRHPRPSGEELNKLYQSGHAESWSTPVEQRTDWQLVREWLKAQKGVSRIMDVGCFEGRLLEFLGRDYAWLGVEIHEEAARRARARGVDVVSSDFAKLSELNADVDVILAVDVIEHSFDPKIFLTSLAACVRPGGYVVVTTGNTEAPSWRLMGSRYWYCHIAEHLSFINPSWAESVAPQLGLEIEYLRLFSHAEGRASLKQRVYETSANLLLRFAPKLFALLRRFGAGGIDLGRYPGLAHSPPYWMSAKDHILVVFRKTCTK
jgi:2-polyprenyl-3-methyl-5-hydroxy-6-metoxy-1,4-benzoquinol methylase